jgi:D-alanyl-D-alanine carboxypeptidase
MRKYTIIALFFTCCFHSAVAQTINKPKIDSLFDLAAADNQAMGSFALSTNGKLAYQKAIGYSSIEGSSRKAATVKTHYRIGSITKLFTAAMIFQLIGEGKLTLDTKLSVYYPSISKADQITISELLSHRSGLFNFVSDTTYQASMTKPHTQEEMIANFAAQQPEFEPGTRAEYSNTNYVLLGYIVEQLTKKTYAEALTQKITSKIGLSDTYYGTKASNAKNEAYSYQYEGSWHQLPETDMSIPGGAGAIVSTPADLVKFIEALFAGKLIRNEYLSLMTNIRDGYGMGMFALPLGNKKAFGHNGDIDGFSSVVGYFPEQKLAYAYCGNGIDYPIKDLVSGALKIYANQDYEILVFKTPVLTNKELDKYVGNYSSLRVTMKIAVTRKGSTLFAQVEGQPAFALKPLDLDKFGYALAGILMEFRPLFGELTLKQGKNAMPFTKDQ